MKKISIILLILTGILVLGGCGKKQELVWLVQNPELVELRQVLLDSYLEEKGVDYTVTLKSVLVDPAKIDNLEDYDEVDLITELDYDTYTAKIQRMADNNEQADIIFVPVFGTSMEYESFTEYGWLEPLDDYLESDNTSSKVYEKIDEIMWEALRLDGTIYGIANPYRASSLSYAYSTYYLDKYDIDMNDISPIMTENEELFKLIKGEEGEDFPVMVLWGTILQSYPIYYCLPSQTVGINQEGTVVNMYNEENVRQYLQDLYELREKGYLYVVDYDGYEVLTEENGYFGISHGVWYTEPIVVDLDIEFGEDQNSTELFVVPQFTLNQYGYYPVRFEMNGITSWSEHKELAFSFLELLYTDSELANLIAYGEEDNDYTQEEGRITYAYSSFGSYTNELLTHSIGQEADNKEEMHEKYYSTGAETAVKSFRFDPTPVQAEVDATNAVLYNDDPEDWAVYTKWGDALEALNAENMSELLDEICEQLEAAGIQKVMDEMQRQWDAFQNNH